MPGSVIVGGARTPMGKLLGGLRDFSGTDLGAVAVRAALERARIAGDQVDYVVLGQVLISNMIKLAIAAGFVPALWRVVGRSNTR